MKLSLVFKLAITVNIITVNLITTLSAKAGTFEEKEIAQEQMVAIAAPYHSGYNLVVIEQIPGKDKCWAEKGLEPVIIDPLLINFDFTSHCYRATDSNGYSIRMAREDRGSDYLLKIVEQGNELVLIAVTRDPNQAPLIIGRTHAKSDVATKIFLDPGWRFTKRFYENKELGHFYFSQKSISVASTNP